MREKAIEVLKIVGTALFTCGLLMAVSDVITRTLP